jgi:hypothetical protein
MELTTGSITEAARPSFFNRPIKSRRVYLADAGGPSSK